MTPTVKMNELFSLAGLASKVLCICHSPYVNVSRTKVDDMDPV